MSMSASLVPTAADVPVSVMPRPRRLRRRLDHLLKAHLAAGLFELTAAHDLFVHHLGGRNDKRTTAGVSMP